MTPDERRAMRAIVAGAIVALKGDAPATLRVLRAVIQLERLLPAPGTPEHRQAFADAHANSE